MSTITGFDNRTIGWVKAVVQKLGGVARADALLRGELIVVEKYPHIFHVDRNIRPTYPDYIKELPKETLDIEATGPEQRDTTTAILFLHPKQKNSGYIKGEELYNFLKESGLIEHCYNLRDGEELVKNPRCYPKSWKGKYIFLWKSVVLDDTGNLRIPFVYWIMSGAVFLEWCYLGNEFHGNDFAVFSKN